MVTAVRRLVAGFKSYRAMYYEQRPERMSALASHGQAPKVLVISCSDSRVDPALLTNSEPGELFVVRNVANLVPPYEPDGRRHGTSAALEFAVKDLGVSDIVILGHSECGGIGALIEGAAGRSQPREFIAPWMSIAERHCTEILGTDLGAHMDPAACEKASVRGSLENLKSFPFVRERIAAKKLALHGWWFELETGRLWGFDPKTGQFRRLA